MNTEEQLVRQIIDTIYKYEDALSDGFEFYGGRTSVENLAQEIVGLMPNDKAQILGEAK